MLELKNDVGLGAKEKPGSLTLLHVELEHLRLLLELEHHVGLGLKEKPALMPCFDVKIGSAFECHVRRVE